MSGEGVGATIAARPRAHGRLVVAGVVGALVVIALVASGGHVPVATEGTGGFQLGVPDAPADRLPPIAPDVRLDQGQPAHTPGSGALGVILQTMVVLVAALFLFLTSSRRRAHVAAHEAGTARVATGPRAVQRPSRPRSSPSTTVSRRWQTGPVDDVVIECWVRLEDAAASAGVERLPSETASELASAGARAISTPRRRRSMRLLARYRTARFSHHPLGEDDRVVAVESLDADPRGDRREHRHDRAPDARHRRRQRHRRGDRRAAADRRRRLVTRRRVRAGPGGRRCRRRAGCATDARDRRPAGVDPADGAHSADGWRRSPHRHDRADAAPQCRGRRDRPAAAAAAAVRPGHPPARGMLAASS